MLLVCAISCGFILDLFLGDPPSIPHPVCWIGWLIGRLEKILRSLLPAAPKSEVAGGLVLVLLVCLCCWLIPWLILLAVGSYSRIGSLVLEGFMCYQIFATRGLYDASMKVYQALKKEGLPSARQALSYIVGRDTESLSQDEVIKAAIETVAENTSDGIIAPMFYMFIGGAPLAFLYKGINTMDSMIGYKNERYLYFGRCAARLDDLANLIPARLSAVLMLAGAFFANLDFHRAWFTFKRDRYNHLSPNSAMTESVAAGALQLCLGGTHSYFGQPVPKATIGEAVREPEAEDIPRMNRLMFLTSFLGLLFFSLGRLCYTLKFF
jgi:adenosylcobinamide-phosphate synthase